MTVKRLLFLSAALATAAVVGACAQYASTPMPAFQPQPVQGGQWEQKADNLVFVLDASSSMLEAYQGHVKFDTARAVAANFNQTMPPLTIRTTLRSFGHDPGVSNKHTRTFFGPAAYDREGLSNGLDQITGAGGTSPLEKALDAVSMDLKGSSGPAAVVIVSDGKDMADAPVQAAQNLASAYNDGICFYTVAVGDDSNGHALLKRIGSLTPCGGAVTASELNSGAAMAAFVRRVLLSQAADRDGDGVMDTQDRCPNTPAGVSVDSRGCPLDSDGDGVADYLDKCPGTPRGVTVDGSGCPLDTDGDGVIDSRDACPGTPRGTAVDAGGCPLPKATGSAQVTAEGTWIYKGIQFESAKWDLKSSSYPVLDEIAAGLNAQPDLRVEIQGHTDSRGNRAYNQDLSQKRAESVRQYLIDKGIAADRLTARGYGPDKPIASNATSAGRAQNRRVELKPIQ